MTKYILPILLIIFTYSCKKEILPSDGSATLQFSNDTIIFDTTFHSIGTPTQTLTIYNRNDFTVLTDISLNLINGGNFRMNVDGDAGNNHNAIEIPSKDSIFIFLEVTPNQNSNNDFLLTSNIEFTTGTKKQDVQLVSPGRNANFHLPHDNEFYNGTDTFNYQYFSIKGQKNWTNDLPHVIYGHVIIEPNATLTIEEGSEIYFHNNAGIYVGNPILINANGTPPLNNGTLIIEGTLGNEVTFRGDRLDSWYDSLPGQWDKIWITPGSINNEFNYCNFQNGTIAIHADTIGNNNPTAVINNCKIDNMSAIGILGQGATLEVNNTIITKCGQYSVVCNIGGDYTFKHCTFANYWNFDHRNTPSILLNNYYEGDDGNIYIRDLNNAYFGNCIIDGNLSTEISFQENDIGNFNYTFDHCLLKIDPNENTETFDYINIIKNESPDFVNKTLFDFHLSDTSLCISSGDFNITQSNPILFTDIEGNIRDNIPDIGIYSKVN